MPPWDKGPQHNIVEDGNFYRCTKCGKTATSEDRFSKTRCQSADERVK